MNIVFLDTRTMGDIPNLLQLHDLGTVILHPDTQPDQTLARIQTAEVVISNKVKISREMMAACPHLKLICVAATGMNNVDLPAAAELGIQVKNVKGYSTDSVAQQAFAMLLSLLHATDYYNRYVHSGEYSQELIFTHLGRPYWELSGKRFGILGLGAIGRQTARIAQAFGAEVVYFSASGQSYTADFERVESLEVFLQTCDVVSIHAPLNTHTDNLLTYEKLAQMKPSALLLNTSRGGIVNEADLVKALDDELIAGAAIDVFMQEPIPPTHPYLRVKHQEKLLLAPHIAWSSMEARLRLMDGVLQNIRDYVAQKGK
jgi:glycerate dehydrogenase